MSRTVARAGFTLIELMVAVAVLSVASGFFGAWFERRRALVVEETQVERALQWLEYEAETRLAKVPPDPVVVGRLAEGLPDAAMEVTSVAADRTTQVLVRFRAATGRERSVSLKLVGVAP